MAINKGRVGARSKQNQHNAAHLGLLWYFFLVGLAKLEFFLMAENLFLQQIHVWMPSKGKVFLRRL